MAISLAPELEQFVAAKVASGMYGSTNEEMQAALSLLAERDEQQRQRISAMDAFIQKGIDSGIVEDEDAMWAEMDAIIAKAERPYA